MGSDRAVDARLLSILHAVRSVAAFGQWVSTLQSNFSSQSSRSPDFVFPNPPFSASDYVTAVDVDGARLSSGLYDTSVTGVSADYMGTFMLRASSDADGTFTVSVRLSETLLRDANRDPITIDSTISVDVDVFYFPG